MCEGLEVQVHIPQRREDMEKKRMSLTVTTYRASAILQWHHGSSHTPGEGHREEENISVFERMSAQKVRTI